MRKEIIIMAIALIIVFFASCKEGPTDVPVNYTVIQEQTVGNIKIAVLGLGGVILSGYGTIEVEFKNAATGELINVSNLSASAEIESGGSTIRGVMNIGNQNSTGNYNINYNLPVKGTWTCIIYFNNENVHFLLSVI